MWIGCNSVAVAEAKHAARESLLIIVVLVVVVVAFDCSKSSDDFDTWLGFTNHRLGWQISPAAAAAAASVLVALELLVSQQWNKLPQSQRQLPLLPLDFVGHHLNGVIVKWWLAFIFFVVVFMVSVVFVVVANASIISNCCSS